jgi:hypothetical protein
MHGAMRGPDNMHYEIVDCITSRSIQEREGEYYCSNSRILIDLPPLTSQLVSAGFMVHILE